MGLQNFAGNNNISNGGPTGIPMGTPTNISSMSNNNQIDIDEYCINYNDRFKSAGTILFRDRIVEQTLSVLIGKTKPNALLIGSAGVGKTKIVEDIAYRLANNDPLIPDRLKGYTIYELPLSNVVAGSSFVGQLEEKVRDIITFMTNKKNKAILFIDEIHQLAGDSVTYEKIAQILKPALARGDMKVIGATTLQESQNLMNDPAFNRRFTRLIVDELSRSQTLEILKNMRGGFFTHYGNKISLDDDVLELCTVIADEYTTAGSHRPDTAITLLDRAIGDSIIARKVQEIKAQNDPAVLAAIKANPMIPITEKRIRTTAMRLMTGNNEKEALNADSLREHLSVIRGQNDILEKVIDTIRRNDLSLFPKKTPLTLLFAGASGVGKTEVTKIIAQELTGVKPITLNMTEYHSPASINRIIGSPAGYVGSDSKAELPFDCLESNPYQVILLDEFEKCDKSVQRLFMSAFDEGYIKTNRGKTVDFSKAIIIATTNASHTETKNTLGFGNTDTTPSNASTIKDLSKWFDTELLNRFHSIYTFHSLSETVYREILANQYETEVARIKVDHRCPNLPDTMPDDDLDALVKDTYVAEFGARPAEKTVRQYIEDHIL